MVLSVPYPVSPIKQRRSQSMAVSPIMRLESILYSLKGVQNCPLKDNVPLPLHNNDLEQLRRPNRLC